MLTATAFVVTSRPQRYIKRLVTHFGNKVTTELTDDGGRLTGTEGLPPPPRPCLS